MAKSKILLQLDTDSQASVFDGVVAVDSGVDHLFRHASVQVSQVRDLAYGAMFTRGVDDLRSTAIFVGGSHVAGRGGIGAPLPRDFFCATSLSSVLHCHARRTTGAAALLAVSRRCPPADAR